MDSVFLSVEGEGGTAGVISNIFYGIRRQMKLKPMACYCEAIDEIAIIPMCVSKETRALLIRLRENMLAGSAAKLIYDCIWTMRHLSKRLWTARLRCARRSLQIPWMR